MCDRYDRRMVDAVHRRRRTKDDDDDDDDALDATHVILPRPVVPFFRILPNDTVLPSHVTNSRRATSYPVTRGSSRAIVPFHFTPWN